MHKYSYRVAWSDEDECYVATSPEFPRLSAFGDTAEGALDELSSVMEAAIEVYKEEGWDLPVPCKVPEYSGQFRLRLPKRLHARLVERAEQEDTSLNTLVVQLISEGLAESNNRRWIQQELQQIPDPHRGLAEVFYKGPPRANNWSVSVSEQVEAGMQRLSTTAPRSAESLSLVVSPTGGRY